MAGPGTTFAGPVISGPIWNAGDARGSVDTGLCVLMQTAIIAQAGASAVSSTFYLPYGSQLLDVLVDVTTAWNAGTSSTFSLGTSAGGTQYAGAVSTQTPGRVRPTFSAAQLTAMANVGGSGLNASVVATITPAGTAPTAGSTIVTLIYSQTVQLTAGEA